MDQISYVYEEEGNTLILKKNSSIARQETKIGDTNNSNLTNNQDELVSNTWKQQNNPIISAALEKESFTKKQQVHEKTTSADTIKEQEIVKNIVDIYSSKKRQKTQVSEMEHNQNSIEQTTKKSKSKLKTLRKEKDVRKIRKLISFKKK